jgi:twitching motility protein PilT
VVAQTLCRKIGGGRCAGLEVLVANRAVANLIREEKSFQIPSIMSAGKKFGNQLMNEALCQLAVDKLVEPDEAMSKATDKDELASRLRREGLQVSDYQA